jgi:putative transposase
MAQSLAQIYLHIVFSTKERRQFLKDDALREEMKKYLGGTCNQLDCPVLRVGGVADHVHILCRLGRKIMVADLVKELKRESSKWIKSKSPLLSRFYWQSGYGAFSVSPGHVDALRTYIENQEEHHKKSRFRTSSAAVDEVRLGMGRTVRLGLERESHDMNYPEGGFIAEPRVVQRTLGKQSKVKIRNTPKGVSSSLLRQDGCQQNESHSHALKSYELLHRSVGDFHCNPCPRFGLSRRAMVEGDAKGSRAR